MSGELDNVLSKLSRVRQQGSVFRALCPAHESKGKTLSLAVAQGHRAIVFTCHAGCSTNAIREALGLPWSALFLEGAAASPRRARFERRGLEIEALMAADRLQAEERPLRWLLANRGWTPEALRAFGVGWGGKCLLLPTYDAEGRLHDLAEYRPWPTQGPKLRGIAGRSKQPWPAPERAAADASACGGRGRWLLLVEGQGTALSARTLGFVTVSLPGSVTKPSGDPQNPSRFKGSGWHRSWAKRLAIFPRIVALPDCDQAGRALMATVAYDLQHEGVRTDVVDLGGPDGFDLGDWAKPIQTPATRRQGRELVNMLIRVSTHEPEHLEEARRVFHAFSRWLTDPAAVQAPAPLEEQPLAPLWDWGAAA